MQTSMCLHIYDTYSLRSRLATTVQRILFFISRSILRSTARRERQFKIGSSFYGSVHAQLPFSFTSINVLCTDQIVLSVIWGSILGYGSRHLMKFCERKDLIDRQSYVAQYISLALLTVGTTTLLGPDDLLASFAVAPPLPGTASSTSRQRLLSFPPSSTCFLTLLHLCMWARGCRSIRSRTKPFRSPSGDSFVLPFLCYCYGVYRSYLGYSNGSRTLKVFAKRCSADILVL